MESKKFVDEIEMRLTSLAPEMIPGVIKKQLDNLGVGSEELNPRQAKDFIERVTEALQLIIGPEGSNSARKLMMRKLRQSCSPEELDEIFMQ